MAGIRRPVVHILSAITGLRESLQAKLPGVTVVNVATSSQDLKVTNEGFKDVQQAEVLLADPTLVVDNKLTQDLPNLKWLMSTWAGVNSFIDSLDPKKITETQTISNLDDFLPERPQNPMPTYKLTRLAGQFGPHMAEFVAARMIAHERRFDQQRDRQMQKIWSLKEFQTYRLLSQLTLGILGAGDIGKDVARIAKAFGMTVWALVRREVSDDHKSPNIDHYRQIHALPEVLSHCDYVCSILPSTPATRGLLSGETLSNCKKGAVLINVGRGDVIDDDSLLRALSEGWLSHAILDVFSTEPLPEDSPLWSHPQVTISPHVSAVSFDYAVSDVFVHNYKKYEKGEPLDYLVDWSAQY